MSIRGYCLCTGVRFSVHGPLRQITECYCDQCRHWSGNLVAATAAAADQMNIDSDRDGDCDLLCWYRSSEQAERGFCRHCGSSLFWRRLGGDSISIMGGALRDGAHLSISKRIYESQRPGWHGDPVVNPAATDPDAEAVEGPVNGGCLCGAVRYRARGLSPLTLCHCSQCLCWSGHYLAASAVPSSQLRITQKKADSGENPLCWYASSSRAERGFCRLCGSSLFWRGKDSDSIEVAAGTLDQVPADLAIGRHLHLEDKPSWY